MLRETEKAAASEAEDATKRLHEAIAAKEAVEAAVASQSEALDLACTKVSELEHQLESARAEARAEM